MEDIEDRAIFLENFATRVSWDLWNDLVTNDDDRGGRICLIVGEQGCGKTTLLRRIAEALLEQDTIVVWRGREFEQVHWFENWKELCVFHHHENDDFNAFLVIGDSTYRIPDINVKSYSSPKDLLNKLEHGKINVVYEPVDFMFDEEIRLLEVVKKALGFRASVRVKKEPQESIYFWFEFIYLLITRMNTYWYALIIDECDDVFPESPKSLKWRLQEWAKNCIKDLRKSRVSLIMSTHSIVDIDYRIRSKIQFFIYMKNAKIPDGSTIKMKTITHALNVGDFIIENGYFGGGRVEPYKRPLGDMKIVLKRKSIGNGDEDGLG